jgi:hypothetical protein
MSLEQDVNALMKEFEGIEDKQQRLNEAKDAKVTPVKELMEKKETKNQPTVTETAKEK